MRARSWNRGYHAEHGNNAMEERATLPGSPWDHRGCCSCIRPGRRGGEEQNRQTAGYAPELCFEHGLEAQCRLWAAGRREWESGSEERRAGARRARPLNPLLSSRKEGRAMQRSSGAESNLPHQIMTICGASIRAKKVFVA